MVYYLYILIYCNTINSSRILISTQLLYSYAMRAIIIYKLSEVQDEQNVTYS